MRYACLLRGINVSGHRKVSMNELLTACTDLGFEHCVSYLQSGNLILDSTLKAADVESALERQISRCFGYADVTVMALTARYIADVIKGVPDNWSEYERSTLHFSFLKEVVTPARSSVSSNYLPDEYVVGKRVVYVHCPNGYGRTRLNNSFFERLLDTQATTRNWNTTSKLLQLADT